MYLFLDPLLEHLLDSTAKASVQYNWLVSSTLARQRQIAFIHCLGSFIYVVYKILIIFFFTDKESVSVVPSLSSISLVIFCSYLLALKSPNLAHSWHLTQFNTNVTFWIHLCIRLNIFAGFATVHYAATLLKYTKQ